MDMITACAICDLFSSVVNFRVYRPVKARLTTCRFLSSFLQPQHYYISSTSNNHIHHHHGMLKFKNYTTISVLSWQK